MMSSVVTRLLPDLDDELTHALRQLEELLLTLAVWEDGPDAPLALPAPLADRQALQALERVAAVVTPTQTRAETTAPPGCELLGPDGHYEHLPLRLVEVDEQDLAVLAAAAAVLGRELATRPHGELAEAMEARRRRRPRRLRADDRTTTPRERPCRSSRRVSVLNRRLFRGVQQRDERPAHRAPRGRRSAGPPSSAPPAPPTRAHAA